MSITWIRTICNAYQPHNQITFEGDDDGNPYALSGFCSFSDGFCYVEIRKESNGFSWRNDDRRGTAETFDEAWANLPGFVTNPDHYDDEIVSED